MTDPKRPHFEKLFQMCEGFEATPTAVVCPEEELAFDGAYAAHKRRLIDAIMVGNRAKIEAIAKTNKVDPATLVIQEANSEEEAASRAVELVHEGRARAIMKGHIHTDELLGAIVKRDTGLRTGTRLSHSFLMDIPNWPKPVIITDAAVNIAPDVKTKKAIVQNAINLAQAIGIKEPKVAMLSATESVSQAMPSSIEADEVAQAAKAGEITGGLVDGPFAIDNAVSEEAAKIKGIKSPVAGKADILCVPTIEAGNILFKALTFMAGSETAGVVIGAKVPVMLTSRADSEMARLASCALAALYDNMHS